MIQVPDLYQRWALSIASIAGLVVGLSDYWKACRKFRQDFSKTTFLKYNKVRTQVMVQNILLTTLVVVSR